MLPLSGSCFCQAVDAWNSKKEWQEWIPRTNMSNLNLLSAVPRISAGAKGFVRTSHMGTQSVHCSNSWRCLFLQLHDAAITGHNTELVERSAAVRNRKLLVGGGCLEFPKK